ncbi:DUF58 domain-containing protein [Bacteriovorax sp. Seq25_V]|uniref:DUF58 domain-containing protein n=1 Tax=Bacteriovorax sp. Seq25_V TaxID=1201288 RepID=UPI0012F8F0F2|nr:DUF58 domain-containing protein [Bacteriovorax sp. Seq25_V]
MKNLRARYRKFLNSFEKESKVYILPSRFGFFYLTVTFISFVFSLSFGHPLSYFFSIVLLVFFVMIAFLTNNYMKGIDVQRVDSLILTEENAVLRLSFSHTSSVPAYFHIYILDHDYLVKRYESNLRLDLETWGSVKDVNLKISSVYPFFLFKSWKNILLIKNLYIVPSFTPDVDGEIENEDFELRNYIYGDNYSRINWKRSSDERTLVTSLIEYGESDRLGNIVTFDLVERELKKELAKLYLGKLYFYYQNRWQVRNSSGKIYRTDQLRANILTHMEKFSYGS